MFVRRFVSALLLILVANFVTAQEAELSTPVTPSPGRYAGLVRVTHSDIADRSLGYRFKNQGTVIPFTQPIILDAPRGAEIGYEIEIVGSDGEAEIVDTLTYVIDRSPPNAPVPDVPPGAYDSPIQISFSTTHGEAIRYSVDSQESGEFDSAQSEPVTLDGMAGQVRDYELLAYSIDEVGNQSSLSRWTYRIDRTNERNYADPWLVSPVEGSFANEQVLAVDTRGLSSVEFSLDGGESWNTYTGFYRFSGTGERNLIVRAVTTSGNTLREMRNWSQLDPEENRTVDTDSGTFSNDLTVTPGSRSVRYTIGDTPVRSNSPLLLQPLRFAKRSGTRQFIVLRTVPTSSSSPREERYVYILDGRLPPPPEFIGWNGLLSVFSMAATDVSVSFDGRFQDVTGEPIPIPDNISTVTARARYPGGSWGPEKSWDVPVEQASEKVELLDDPRVLGDRYTASFSDSGFDLQLSLDDETFSEPFRTEEATVTFRLPRGFRNSVILRNEAENFLVSTPVDLVPPERPTISVDSSGQVTITGNGTVWYRVVQGSQAPLEYTSYANPFRVTGTEGIRTDYRIDAYSEFSSGLRSEITTKSFSVDLRSSEVPPLTGVTEGGIYNSSEISISFANPFPDLEIYYEISKNGTRAAIPSTTSSKTADVLSISTDPEVVITYNLAFRAKFTGSNEWSSISRLSFSVDRSAPEPPRILAPAAGSVVATPINLYLADPAEEGVKLFYRTAESEEYRRYTVPVLLSTPDRTRREFIVSTYTEDPAGNRTFLGESVSIIVDREPPATPRLFHGGQEITSKAVQYNSEAVIDLRSSDSLDRIYFSIGASGTSEGSDLQEWRGEPLVFHGVAGETRTYALRVFAQDDLGNISGDRTLEVEIDLDAPSAPPVPTISRDPSGSEGYLFWNIEADTDLFVSIDRTDFVLVTGPVAWSLQGRSLDVHYFTIDGAGNRSDTTSLRIAPPNIALPPVVTGVRNGRTYADSVRVSVRSENAVRYTVATDGGSAPPVHNLSTQLKEPIFFNAAPGEQLEVELRLRSFPERGEPSDEETIRFTIDRKPPDPPSLVGVVSGTYYPVSQTARLHAETDDTLFYRKYREDLSGDLPPFRRYSGEIIFLEGAARETRRYVIEAYTEDRAGNRSQFVSRWPVIIDQEIVYVSPDALSVGSGSRDDPYRDLISALQNASQQRKSTIFLAPGSYELRRDTLSLLSGDESFHFVGWDGVPSISSSGGVLEVPGGTEFRRIRLATTIKTAPSGSDRAIVLDTVLFELSGDDNLITVDSLALELYDSVVPSDALIRVEAGSFRAENSELAHIVASSSSDISLESVTLDSLTADDSLLEIDQSIVDGPLVLRSSDLELSSSIVRSDSDSILVSAQNSNAAIFDSTLVNSSESGTIALHLIGGTLTAERSIFAVSGTSTLQYTVTLRSVDADVKRSFFYSAGREESIPLASTGGKLTVTNCTLAVEGGDFSRYGITSTGSTITVTSSVIVSLQDHFRRQVSAGDTRDRQTAIYLALPATEIDVSTNRFSGWDATLYNSSRGGWNRRSYVSRPDYEISLMPSYGVPPVDRIFSYDGNDRSAAVFSDETWSAPTEEMIQGEIGPLLTNDEY